MFDSNSVWIFFKNVSLTSWLYSKSEHAHYFLGILLNLVCLAGEGCQN